MSGEVATHPQALQQGFGERLAIRLAERSLDRITTHLAREGILGALGDRPWDTYMQIVDGLRQGADPELGERNPALMTVPMRFSSSGARDNFRDIYTPILAGIHGFDTAPDLERGGPRTLTARNFGYEDLSSGGRVGSALLRYQCDRDEDMEVSAGNARLLRPLSLSKLEAISMSNFLPDKLAVRMEFQKKSLPATVEDSFLGSGALAILGTPMRNLLEENGLPIRVQRPRGNRPFIEGKTLFFWDAEGSAEGDLPISNVRLGKLLWSQVKTRFGDLTDPYANRQTSKILEDAFDLTTGGILTKVGGAALEGMFTVANTVPVAAQMIADKWRLHKQGKASEGLQANTYSRSSHQE